MESEERTDRVLTAVSGELPGVLNTDDQFAHTQILTREIKIFPIFRNGTPISEILRDNVKKLCHFWFLIGV